MANIIGKVLHRARVLQSRYRERKKESERSPHWASVRDHYIEQHPLCAACSGTEHLQVHHKKPFHEFPDLELEPENLIVLCMGLEECHLRIGHGGNYKFYNPNVEEDAKEVLGRPTQRRVVVARAKSTRLVNG